jgi:hypothetical protein
VNYRDYVAHVEPFENEYICWDHDEVKFNIRKFSDVNLRLSDLLKSYITNIENGVSAKTTYKMQTHIEFLIDTVGDIKVDDFDKEKLRMYRNKLSERTILSKGTEQPLASQTKNDHILVVFKNPSSISSMSFDVVALVRMSLNCFMGNSLG